MLIRQQSVPQKRTVRLLGSPVYRNNGNGKDFDNVYIWLNISRFPLQARRGEI